MAYVPCMPRASRSCRMAPRDLATRCRLLRGPVAYGKSVRDEFRSGSLSGCWILSCLDGTLLALAIPVLLGPCAMISLLTCDPGSDGNCGFCRDVDGTIVSVWCGVPADVIRYGGADVLTIEIPQVYPGDPVPPQDLVTLALAAGEVIGFVRSVSPNVLVRRPFPRQWKGQVPKRVHNARVMKLLAPRDHTTVLWCLAQAPASRRPDMTDAVGLRLWTMKPFGGPV